VDGALVADGQEEMHHRVRKEPVPVRRVDLDRQLVRSQRRQTLALSRGRVLDLAQIVVRPRAQDRVIEALPNRLRVHGSGHRIPLHGHLEVVDAIEAEQQKHSHYEYQSAGAYRARTPEGLPQV
jgi:hypothetical protein